MATKEHSSEIQISTFLADLAHANHSPQTCRAYASDLAQLCAFHQGPIQTITVEVLRKFFEMHAHLRPACKSQNSHRHCFVQLNGPNILSLSCPRTYVEAVRCC